MGNLKEVKMRVLTLGAALAAVGSAFATATVSDITVRQHWPFDRQVEISYVLSGADVPVDIAFAAKNGEEKLTIPAKALKGDVFSVGNGRHVIRFDPSATDYANRASFASFKVALQPVPERKYMIVDLNRALAKTAAARVSYTNEVIGTEKDAAGGRAWDDEYKTEKLVLRRIPAGEFTAGSPSDAQYHQTSEPLQRIKITEPFYIGVFEFTQRQMELVQGSRWCCWHTNDQYYATRPVDNTQYNHCESGGYWPTSMGVANFLYTMRGVCGGDIAFHLPTEAQWEYAARAGSTNLLYNTEEKITNDKFKSFLKEVANAFRDAYTVAADRNVAPADGGTMAVGSFKPNAWGLYDVIGNVCEWTRDWWDAGFGSSSETWLVDPYPLSNANSYRCYRGGAYSHKNTNDDNYYSRVLCRLSGKWYCAATWKFSPITDGSIGFRLWAPDQPIPVDEAASYSDAVTVSVSENFVYPMVRSSSATLRWDVPEVWGTNLTLASTEVCVGGSVTVVDAGVTSLVWQCTAPEADAMIPARISFRDESGADYAVWSNDVVLLKSTATGSADVLTTTNTPKWAKFRTRDVPLAYSANWVPFGATNDAPGSFSIRQSDLAVEGTVAAPAGWRRWNLDEETPWPEREFDLSFDFSATSPLANGWNAHVKLCDGGMVLIVR